MGFGGYLKADTATKLVIGPLVAYDDGVTPVTDMTLASADVLGALKFDIATLSTFTTATWATAIGGASGYYNLDFKPSLVDTEGRITVIMQDADKILPIRTDYEVVSANVYDSLFAPAATDYLDVNTVQIASSLATTKLITTVGDLEVDNDGTAISLIGAFKLALAVLTGKSSGGGGATLVFRDINDAKNRISATVDANGNRTAVGTRDAS